jgi:hypothetical protein
MPIIDTKNALTYAALIASKSQNNNTGGGGLDLQGYIGKVSVVVNVGVKTTGDADATITLRAMTSATNNISNATNYGTSTVSTSNNTSAVGTIAVDVRDASRYLFLGVAITGTNTPAYPLGATVVGEKQVQPVQ